MIDHQSSYLHRRRPVKTDFLTTQSTASVLDRQSYLRDSCSIRYLYSIIVLVLFHSFHGYMSDTYITAQHYDYTALEYMTAQHYDYTALIYDSTALQLLYYCTVFVYHKLCPMVELPGCSLVKPYIELESKALLHCAALCC